jgi:hypothetical protein
VEISTDPQQFEVDLHVHCNKPGNQFYGKWIELTSPPPTKVDTKPKLTLKDVAPDRVQYIIKKKMSQKERKRLEADKRARNGLLRYRGTCWAGFGLFLYFDMLETFNRVGHTWCSQSIVA